MEGRRPGSTVLDVCLRAVRDCCLPHVTRREGEGDSAKGEREGDSAKRERKSRGSLRESPVSIVERDKQKTVKVFDAAEIVTAAAAAALAVASAKGLYIQTTISKPSVVMSGWKWDWPG